jgi:hypothetical protein
VIDKKKRLAGSRLQFDKFIGTSERTGKLRQVL